MSKRNEVKIHVLHLIGSTGLYGAERWILALMRATDADRIDSTLINLVDSEGEKSSVVSSAQQRGLKALDFYTGGKFNLFSAVRLARWARKEGIHIIHGHGFKSDAVGLLAARLAGCKAVTTPHGWNLAADSKLKLYEKLDKALFRFMDMVCPLSPDLASGMDKWTTCNKIRLIFNGVDLDEIRDATKIKNMNSGCYTIGYIGQLIKRKDLHTLFSSFRILSDRCEKVRLIVVGDGPELSALKVEAFKLGIGAKVEFTGFRPDAASFLSMFNVFVLPSLMEGIPRCIMEAMAARIPVVASDIPGNRSIVIPGETGLLFTPGDSCDLTEKISYLMMHSEEAESLADRARIKVEQEFSSKRMAKEYEALYCELMVK